jgi:hypothetical protein
MDELDYLAAKLDKLPVDPQARMGYDLFAGGLVWSDEKPDWDDIVEEEQGIPTVVGLGTFRVLLNHRHALILGEPAERFRELWDRAKILCPNWPGFLPGRQDSALADEARARSEASIRSFDEADERFRQQQQAKASMTTA